ncbi:MAG: SDR family oxidoreductase [Microthrixaceae bacterium]|nr:SDR family oxidoreductase [Microthrixaceae bacterium]MCB1010694.1 SDR family oxidoreductase [Microthrixaceae bacterium]MCB9386300.1 SDR family oxidoreductase [Microthrixaceae bacterium]MCO5320977.1 SDR family oxidoreductase [Microthrixaceae bacterium]
MNPPETARTANASPRFDPAGRVCVVTGAAGGIGAALVRALGAAGASVIVAADLDEGHMASVADVLRSEIPGTELIGVGLDVTDRDSTRDLVDQLGTRHGGIDLWCANAGIGTAGGVDTDPQLWQRTWEVNVLAHVHAADALLPGWTERGRGHLLVTASAAGLLTNLGDAPYSVTKHGAVAFAEWLAIAHGHAGIGVTCLCPQGVRTAMVFGDEADEFASLRSTSLDSTEPNQMDSTDRDEALALQVVRDKGVIEPGEVARCALEALREGRFLALPHPEVAGYEQKRAADRDRWILGMRRLQAQLDGRAPDPPAG